jgi:hypothetical protein
MSISTWFRVVSAAGLLLMAACVRTPPGRGGEKPEADPKPKAETPAPAQVGAEDRAEAEKAAKLLPDPAPAAGREADAGWTLADWEDPGQVQKIDLTDCPVKAVMRLATSGGKKGKSLATLTKDLSLPENGVVRVTAYNPGPQPAKMALAFWVSARWVYYESATEKVDAGAWKVIKFDLAASTFKTERTKWQYTAKLVRPETTKRVGLLIMSIPEGKPAAVYLCGLGTEKSKAVEEGPPAALTQRITKLKALVERMKKAGKDPGYFWSAEREKSLGELLDKHDYRGADKLLNEALEDYKQYPAKDLGEPEKK